jgi:hypothetical protein
VKYVAKLNQVIAVEKTVKTRVQVAIDGLYKAIQKPALFDGFTKTYKPSREDEAAQPAETKRVQYTAQNVLQQVREQLSDLFEVVSKKDFANTGAKADIEVAGTVIASGVPTTYLLFLEKQLTDLQTLVGKIPTLDPSEDWTWDDTKQVWKTEATETLRTRKVAKPLVLFPATVEHPAQTQVLMEDIPVGTYVQTKLSGATTEQERRKLLARIVVMQQAVKFAREQANLVQAPDQEVAAKVLDWIFTA